MHREQKKVLHHWSKVTKNLTLGLGITKRILNQTTRARKIVSTSIQSTRLLSQQTVLTLTYRSQHFVLYRRSEDCLSSRLSVDASIRWTKLTFWCQCYKTFLETS